MHNFLIEKFGEKRGNELSAFQQRRLDELVIKTKLGVTEKKKKTLRKTIMPKISLYQILQESGFKKQKAYDITKEYMIDVRCAQMKKQLKKMDKIPFFYTIFKKMMIKNFVKGGNWDVEVINADSKSFTVHVYKCLWHDATIENGCPELCRAFCECDDVNFAVFTKCKFYREGSLGMGSKKCDFTFKKVIK